jgi:molybdenum cofactor cytidylyltransferase
MPAAPVAGIILAAGASARMGRPKQLLDWGGRPLVRAVAEAALAARLAEVLVVVGAARTDVAAALAGLPLRLVANPAYAAGQSTSLRAGIAALRPETCAALVLLGDQPFVTAAICEALIAAWEQGGALAVAPVYRGRRGNPVLFDRAAFPALLALAGDQGARAWLSAHAESLQLVPFDDDRPLADIDTPEEYERLQRMMPDT